MWFIRVIYSCLTSAKNIAILYNSYSMMIHRLKDQIRLNQFWVLKRELWFYHHSNKLIKSSRIKLNPIYIRFSKKPKFKSDFLETITMVNHSPEMIWTCRFIILIVPMAGALQNLRNWFQILYKELNLAPRAGLEPATHWLTVNRSTNWATGESI